MRTCSRCYRPATFYERKVWLCPIHLRAMRMCRSAAQDKKAVPSRPQMEAMITALLADGLRCPHCRRTMNWHNAEGRSTVVSLQHDRDGTVRLICFGCNVKHQFHPGDTFYSMPAGRKRCPECGLIKPTSDFYARPSGKLFSKCKLCARAESLARYHAKTGATHADS